MHAGKRAIIDVWSCLLGRHLLLTGDRYRYHVETTSLYMSEVVKIILQCSLRSNTRKEYIKCSKYAKHAKSKKRNQNQICAAIIVSFHLGSVKSIGDSINLPPYGMQFSYNISDHAPLMSHVTHRMLHQMTWHFTTRSYSHRILHINCGPIDVGKR